jgi:hypothetical protein
MEGLQRRYTLDEILAIKKGIIKIKPPLNYDALRILRDPLYVKFGQTLKEESADRTMNVIADQEFKLLLQKIASERNVPYDLLEELIRNMPKGGGGGGGGDPGSGPSGSNDPGSGGGGGPSGSGGGRDYSATESMSFSDTESVRSESQPSQMPPPSSKKRSERPDDNQGPPPPPMTPTAMLRSNLEIEAQIQELRDELRKQNRQEKIVREIVQAPREENPIKEIIREFHQIITPTPLPQVPARQDESLINAQLIQALQQAMARNENLALMAQHMGMTMNQFVEYMKAQLRRPEESASSSSSSGRQPPPQPPPPPPIAVSNERKSRTRSPYAPAAPLPPPPPAAAIENVIADAKATLPPEKPRTRSPKRTGTTAKAKAEPPPKRGRSPTPIAINTAPSSRAVSLASTIPYDDQEHAQEKLARSRSTRGQAGAAVEEIVLPIEGGTTRGRSPVNKVDRIMSAIAESQNRALVKGQIRHQLGNFAKSFAKSQKQNKAQKRAATIEPAPLSRVKTFDEIAEIVDRAPSTEPAAASFQKRIPLVGGSDIVRRRLK